MGTVEIKARIHEIVDGLDESFLKVVHSMLDTYAQQKEEDPIEGYDIDGTPRTSSELEKILDERLELHKQNPESGVEWTSLKGELLG